MGLSNTTRQDFINQYRREMGWSGIAVALGALAFVLVPMFLNPSPWTLLGAMVLAPTMAYAAWKSVKIYRATDREVLHAAGERYLGIYGLLALGMVLFGYGSGGAFNAFYMVAILIAVMPGEVNRVRQARNHLTELV